MNIDEIVKNIHTVGDRLKGVLESPVPPAGTKKLEDLSSVNGSMGVWEKTWNEYKLLEKENKLSEKDIQRFHDAYSEMLRKFEESASKYPQKMKYVKDHITEFAEFHKSDMKGVGGKLTKFLESLEIESKKESSLFAEWEASFKAGKASGSAVKKPALREGKELRETLEGWKKSVSGFFDDAVEKGKEVAKDVKDGVAGASTGAADAAAEADAADGTEEKPKKGGFFDGFKGKEIAGGAIGGVAGFMIGKIFGNGWVGTVIGAMLAIGGAIMGRNFARDHFNGDKKDGVTTQNNVNTGANQNAGVSDSRAVSAGGHSSEQSVGMTDEQLRAALDRYNERVHFQPYQATEQEIQDRIMRQTPVHKRRENDSLYPGA